MGVFASGACEISFAVRNETLARHHCKPVSIQMLAFFSFLPAASSSRSASGVWALCSRLTLSSSPYWYLLLCLLSGSIPERIRDQEQSCCSFNIMFHKPLLVSCCRSQSEHLPLLLLFFNHCLASQVILCFTVTHCSPLFTFSNPLTLSLPLLHCSTFSDFEVNHPFVPLVYPPCLSRLLVIPSPPPFPPTPPSHHLLVSPRAPPPLPRTSSAAVVYIHIAPATTCWFSRGRAAHRVIRITVRTPLFTFNSQVWNGHISSGQSPQRKLVCQRRHCQLVVRREWQIWKPNVKVEFRWARFDITEFAVWNWL